MATLLRKIVLLTWKNMKLLQRHYFKTAFEMLIPILLFLLVAFIQSHSERKESFIQEPTYFEQRNGFQLKFPFEDTDVYYTPSNNFTDKLMKEARQRLDVTEVIPVPTESDLERIYAAHHDNHTSREMIAVVFVSKDADTKGFNYRIRGASSWRKNWRTGQMFPGHVIVGPASSSDIYFWTGFVALQQAVDWSFINSVKPKDSPAISYFVQEFPYPPYTRTSSQNIGATILMNFFLYGYALLCVNVLGKIVEDKHSGVTELLKLMGLSRPMLWLTWFIQVFFIKLIIVSVITIFLTVPFEITAGAVFTKSNGFLVWLFLMITSVAIIAFWFMISTFFSRAWLAVTMGSIIWVLSYSIGDAIIENYSPLSFFAKLVSSLLPTVALHWGLKIIEELETSNEGVIWSNLFTAPSRNPADLTMANVIFMLIFDTCLYGFLTWYLDSILPGVYGIPEPINFLFRKSYWQTSRVESAIPRYGSADTLIDTYESPPHGLKVGIRIADLRKDFRGKAAVDGVTIDIYQDQITALLGHNGAGKTTTMSIMTGMLPATSGSVWINDYNIRTDMAKVRESLGLCPQHDMLFNDLTVKEHLIFFGMLKGLHYSEAVSAASDLLEKLHISEKADSMAATLSGGMKRKLSLGIALIGGSKVVILDEPTSGLDPEARRHIWDLLLGMRGERTILITTHFMEEADVLGDRIAIMDHGRVQCYGTSLYLKNKYGAGYVLKLLTLPSHDVGKITQLVDSKVAGARLRSRLGSELAYTLPQERKPQFPELFSVLEASKQELAITSVGVSITTMEDVFLQVGHDAVDGRGDEQRMPASDSDQSLQGSKRPHTTGLERLAQQAQALIIKKLIYMRRKWISLLIYALHAILMMVAVVALSYISLGDISSPDNPALQLSLNQSSSAPVLFSATNQTLTRRLESLVKEARCEPRPILNGSISGALLHMADTNMGLYQSLLVAAEVNVSARALNVNAMYASLPYHSAPISINLMNNALLKNYVGDSYSIQVTNDPLQIQETIRQPERALSVVWWSLLIPLGLLFLVGSCLAFPLEERVSGCKHLQLMAGVRPIGYWLSCFVCDYLFYVLVAGTMVIVLVVLDVERTFGGAREAGVFFLLLLLYGCSGIPYAYLFSYFKKTAASGLSVFIGVNFFLGLILPSVMMILDALALEKAWGNLVPNLIKLFYLFPPFNIFFAVKSFSTLAVMMNECSSMTEEERESICPNIEEILADMSYTEFDTKEHRLGIGWQLTMLGVGCVFFFALILLINHGITSQLYEKLKRIVWRNRSTNQSEDEVDADVRIETDRVHGGNDLALLSMTESGTAGGRDALTVTDLMKKYGLKEAAVKGVSFGVTSGDCFGLLGFNGAGKTSVFKMLTGVELPTRGEARINDYTLSGNKAQFMSQIGYCPQFDAINDFLTGREMLQLFARLRGVDSRDVETTVDKWLKLMDLEEYKNLKCGKYSGGNKRKLSTAMALIGDPPLIFLDEPTTGVDPVARRNLWSVLARVQQHDRAIVLTTHSMEECEALCSRLAIMVQGQFVCIGENQYLKQKFGQGFTVTIKLGDTRASTPGDETTEVEQASVVKNAFEKMFKRGNCNLKYQRHGLLHYHLTDPNIPWNYLFSNMESLKNRLEAVEDYTVSETTLEQVFLSFAKV